MKQATTPFFSTGSKRWGIFFLLLVLHISGPAASQAQSISVQVNSYLKTQVKETTARGVLLVAENMTDWLSQTNAAPVSIRKTNTRNSGNTSSQQGGNTTIAKLKCPAVSKTVKRP
ncbi:hypothetical protein [Adhaeribacter pallidiroseus]|uniref:Uncharacterized protein n=1 Tax=Adhaeribacter pallidiroseus TaxID=2072847 RepID=A0A369QUD6_9BACT|nr:hypothetical protein [Adhaeribacter pallidiroseus]RDC65788.1 hypothetical protein AHMF7616_04418 [Adhaeribacter pallidiroseus]